MTSKELIQKLDSHMRVNKITRKSVADKLGVTSSAVGRILAADNCGLYEFSEIYDVCVGSYKTGYFDLINKFSRDCIFFGLTRFAEKLETTPSKVKRMIASENMKLSTFLKLTKAAGVTNDYFKFD